MHEFTTHLERLFKAKILYMNVDQNRHIETIPSPFVIVHNTHVMPPSMTIRVNLALYKAHHPQDYMHVFRPITTYAVVTNVKYEPHSMSGRGAPNFPKIYTVEFVVFDYENFAKDIEKYSWEDFNEEFNTQLDKVLKEE